MAVSDFTAGFDIVEPEGVGTPGRQTPTAPPRTVTSPTTELNRTVKHRRPVVIRRRLPRPRPIQALRSVQRIVMRRSPGPTLR